MSLLLLGAVSMLEHLQWVLTKQLPAPTLRVRSLTALLFWAIQDSLRCFSPASHSSRWRLSSFVHPSFRLAICPACPASASCSRIVWELQAHSHAQWTAQGTVSWRPALHAPKR